MVSDIGPTVDAARLLTRLLVVSTRAPLRQLLAVALTEVGFAVAITADGATLARRIGEVVPHATLIDMLSLAHPLIGIARDASDAPILALVPVDAPAVATAALEQGADDCITVRESAAEDAAFTIELLWRVNGILRRSNDLQEPFVGLIGPSGICMRPHSRDLTVGGRPLALTPHEFDILRILLERRGEVVPTPELASTVWGPPLPESRGWVQSHVSHMRAKLRELGAADVITTVRGFGYVIR